MIPAEIVRRKRDGHALSGEEIAFLIAGLSRDIVGAEQAAAFAMAVFFRGMTATETADLTRAMAQSGKILDWRADELGGPVLDKHSTGGVGDNVSLVVAPILAACGAFVPMIAGRGLGHTGGTLDKLDAIPGYVSQPDLATFQRAVRSAGCAIVGQTPDLAPADRQLYAIRDVTGTVESVPLITASILAKKLAAGLDALVMDVKCGNGAFMTSREDARELARAIVDTAAAAGLRVTALITGMDAPLASCAGNAVEVRHALDHLTGLAHEPDFLEVTLALASEVLVLGGLADSVTAAREKATGALASGRAAEHFARMCAALGGPADILENAPTRTCHRSAGRAGHFIRSARCSHGRRYARARSGGDRAWRRTPPGRRQNRPCCRSHRSCAPRRSRRFAARDRARARRRDGGPGGGTGAGRLPLRRYCAGRPRHRSGTHRDVRLDWCNARRAV